MQWDKIWKKLRFYSIPILSYCLLTLIHRDSNIYHLRGKVSGARPVLEVHRASEWIFQT